MPFELGLGSGLVIVVVVVKAIIMTKVQTMNAEFFGVVISYAKDGGIAISVIMQIRSIIGPGHVGRRI